jgi:rod shape-determining protein MreB
MWFRGADIGVDLGTATVLVYVKNKGIVLNEPSVVAIDRNTNKIFAVGEEARKMLGRTPGNIVAIRPLREGVIADYDTTEKMLRHFIEKSCGKSLLFRPRVMVCIPSGARRLKKASAIWLRPALCTQTNITCNCSLTALILYRHQDGFAFSFLAVAGATGVSVRG